MHFATPQAFLLLAALPWTLGLEFNTIFSGLQKSTAQKKSGSENTSRAAKGVSFTSPVAISGAPVSSLLRELRVVPPILRAIALVSLIIALARPQSSVSFSEVDESGRDIVLALDISGSMRALDFFIDKERVDRLTALKSVVRKFIEQRKGDRMGLVIFGSDVFTQCPLTLDTHVLDEFVAGLDFGMVGDGTALGDGIAVAVKRLKDIPGNSKVIVLVTDGINTAGSIEPKEAAAIAKEKGIKIYTIGIGGDKPAPFKMTNPFGFSTYDFQAVQLDEKTLKVIADSTGGRYFRAQETEKLEDVYSEISRLEERIAKSVEYTDYKEHYLTFLLIGFLAFILHEILISTRYLVVP